MGLALKVNHFVYLRSMVSADGGTELDDARGINSGGSVFATLAKIRKCNYLDIKIKLNLFCTNVPCCYMGVARRKRSPLSLENSKTSIGVRCPDSLKVEFVRRIGRSPIRHVIGR